MRDSRLNQLEQQSISFLGKADEKRRKSFLALYEESREDLRSYIGTLVIDINDADDVFQELCLTLWDKFDEFDPERSFLTWAKAIAYNDARSYWKRRKRQGRGTLDPEVLQSLNRIYQGQSEFLELLRERVRECMAQLAGQDQQLIVEVYEGELKIGELAKRKGKTAQSIYTRISRLRDRIRHCVERKSHG
ncbi:RNA polymerase sigma factor [Calycomorphotria hydatis]|uniref:RNA polymerase sigma factor n=1 Tax=Calycomorphotria hydatis TaxID=2528027 RepID=A0A517TDN1_9PLAN|nr:RNA polymerase sigma factor [Calycomorphotria hydatis]